MANPPYVAESELASPSGRGLPLGATPGPGRRSDRARGARGHRGRGSGLACSSAPPLWLRSPPIRTGPQWTWRTRPVSRRPLSSPTWRAGPGCSYARRGVAEAEVSVTSSAWPLSSARGDPPPATAIDPGRGRPVRRRHHRDADRHRLRSGRRPFPYRGRRPALSR